MRRFEHSLQREMTRKEFLTMLGVGIVSIMGLGTLMRLFFGKPGTLQHNHSVSSYGGSSYGGPKS